MVAASLAVTRAGAREGMPTAAELERALAKAAGPGGRAQPMAPAKTEKA